MEKELKKELESGGAQDPEFNAAVLKRLAPHKARAELRDIHSMLLSRQRTQGTGKAPGLQRSGWRDEVRLILPFSLPPDREPLVPVRFISALLWLPLQSIYPHQRVLAYLLKPGLQSEI